MNSNTTGRNHIGQRSILNLFDHLRHQAHWYLLLFVMIMATLVYYWFEWRTFPNFVEAIDHDSQFMQDFAYYYYPMGQQILHDPKPVSGYFYSSFFALILAPIGRLPLPSAMVIWGGVQFISWVSLCIVAARGLFKFHPLGMVLFVFLCLTSYPILHNIKWGQVSILLTVCVMAAFFSYKKNKGMLAGILLAFAAAIKFYPAIFIIYFILKRNLRTCLAFGLAGFVFYLIFPATVLGFSNWFRFEKATYTGITYADWISPDVNSQYIVHVGLRWFEIIFHQTAGGAKAQALSIVGYLIALSCIAMAWYLHRRVSCEKYGLPMVALFLTIPFVIKTSWPHYFVYLPLCQAALFSYYASSFRSSRLWRKVLCALPIFSMFLSSIFFFNLFTGWRAYNSYGVLFLANLLLLAAVYATIVIEPDGSALISTCFAPLCRRLKRSRGQ